MKNKKKLFHWLFFRIIITIVLIIILGPIIWMGLTAIKTESQALSEDPIWFFSPTFDNFIQLWTGGEYDQQPYLNRFLNSLIIASITTLLSLCIGLPAAYSLVRIRSRQSKYILSIVLLFRMFPPVIFVIPYFILVSRMGIVDTYISLILPYTALSVSLVVWMMQTFINQLPIELEEAALVDGCTRLSAFIRVIFPLLRPGLIASSIFTFLTAWNEFLLALALTRRNAATLPVKLYGFIGEHGIDWTGLAAGSITMIIPIFILVIIGGRHMIQGLSSGAVKG